MQVDHIATNLTSERNHRTLELFALLVVSLGLPVLDPGGARASRAWADLQDNLLTDVWSDGVHRERSSHYHLIALRSFLAARVNITRFGGHIPPAYDERLRAALRFGMHLHRPDGYVPALSDSDSESYLDLLELAADSLDDAGLRYVATRGREGTPPAERCADFPVGGYYVQRSGWGAQEPLRRRALPGLRLRPARRRRPRPLRRPVCRGLRARSPPGRRPRPLHLRGGRAPTGGTGSRAPLRTTP